MRGKRFRISRTAPLHGGDHQEGRIRRDDMGRETKEYREIREVWKKRIRITTRGLADSEKQLAAAEALIITLREARIPELVEKIKETKARLNYNQRTWKRLYGGERDAKKEKIARLRDHIQKLQGEVHLLDQAFGNAVHLKKKKRKKRK